MRNLLAMASAWVVVVSLFVATSRAETFVYVSNASDSSIHIFRMNDDSGALTLVDKLESAKGVGALAADPQRKVLIASLRGTSTLSTFRIDAKSGKLSPINSAASLGTNSSAAFVNLDRQGKFVISASYGAGKVFVHGLDSEGKISEQPIQTVETAKTAHSAMVDAENKMVFVPHVAPNAVYQFKLDSATGKLTDAGTAPGGKEKSGPRHLAFHPSGKFAFTSDESGSSVTLYSLDASGLKPMQTLSTLPANFEGRNSTADVKMHPAGKYVWVSNRGHDSLAGFKFDASTGKLEAMEQTPTEKTPRSFDIEPSGRFVFSGGEGSGKLAAYRVNADSGQLNRIQTYDIGKSVNWVMTLKMP